MRLECVYDTGASPNDRNRTLAIAYTAPRNPHPFGVIMTRGVSLGAVLAASLLLVGVASTASSQRNVHIFDALLGETGQQTPEISTQELRRIMVEKSAVVIDARPFREF